ncbi:uncharacterized protein N7498_003083 [Penicillium cinerascens]|uniref:Uncharacterized protein n=1 Tax=Penicillium cinerascens TaxID=70096 RepID=A0A9W9N1G6_9EURO|nr:uncharacterized protein N7498_003083 [Penicillium cinerascens]KAJ5211437.1 hypothetical protein N7498_003083 [Penicillium cinerascens]
MAWRRRIISDPRVQTLSARRHHSRGGFPTVVYISRYLATKAQEAAELVRPKTNRERSGDT